MGIEPGARVKVVNESANVIMPFALIVGLRGVVLAVDYGIRERTLVRMDARVPWTTNEVFAPGQIAMDMSSGREIVLDEWNLRGLDCVEALAELEAR